MSEEKGIWLITEETEESVVEEPVRGGKWGRDTGADYDDPYADAEKIRKIHRKRTRLKSEVLKNNMSEFLEVVEETFEQAEKPSSNMRLEELELAVEINAEAEVSLLGNGGKAGATGAIILKFKRKDG
ncbi:MAG: hypothetical protein AB4372_37765 [Xenococcus sp. (in: cyanobacteria)]